MRILLAACCVFFLSTSGIYAQNLSVDEAVKVITSTRPFESHRFAGRMGGGLSPSEEKRQTLFNSQLQAIQVIGEEKPKGQVLNLIPYLDYIENEIYTTLGIGISRRPTNGFIREAWPAYGAIVNLPDAAESLKQYSLDKQNPLNYRLATFLVLRDVDKDSFANVRHVLDTEFADSRPSIKAYIKRIEDGSEFFWGVPDLKYDLQ